MRTIAGIHPTRIVILLTMGRLVLGIDKKYSIRYNLFSEYTTQYSPKMCDVFNQTIEARQDSITRYTRTSAVGFVKSPLH